MDSLRKGMDKVGRQPRRELLSQQVTGARYFFLNLAPTRGARVGPALGGRELCNPDYRVVRETYAYDGLEYVTEGAGWVELDGRRALLGPGAVFAYGRETRCEIQTDPARPLVKYFVCLTGGAAAKRLARAGVAPGVLKMLTAHAELRGLFEELIHEGQRPGRLALELCATRLELLLLKIEEHIRAGARGEDPARERFLRCKALIEERAEKLVTLEEIAAAAGLEVSSVCRLFRRHHDCSPYQHLLRRKMTLAAEHLVENGGLVKEAAQRVGFADPYHFSRCFKAVHGVAPRDLLCYRRTG
jgi:AraC family transcriptional regulator